MKNYVESGDTFEIVLTKAMASGDIVVAGELVGVLVNGGVAGDRVAAKRRGVYRYPKVTGALTQGEAVHLNSDNKLTKTATDNPHVGCVFVAAAAGDTEVVFVLKC